MRLFVLYWFMLLALLWASVPGTAQVIVTVAGTGVEGFSGDGGPAVNAQVGMVHDVWVGANNQIYITDGNHGRIRRIDPASGIINTVAGGWTNLANFSGDGGDALKATFYPWAVCTDRFNNMFITDENNAVVLRVDAVTNILTRYAGNGVLFGASNPGMPAVNTALVMPYQSCVDDAGNVLIADVSYSRVRKVDAVTGIMSDITGGGRFTAGDGGLAKNASVNGPEAVCIDPDGNIYILAGNEHRIRKIDKKTGIITTFAGNGGGGIAGEGGPAIQAEIGWPQDIASDGAGNIYFSSYAAIYKIDAGTGILTRVAGTGNIVFSGDVADGTPALAADLRDIRGICIANGDLYFAQGAVYKVRKIAGIVPVTCTPSIVITTPSVSLCEGSAATFTAAIVNGGALPLLTWKRNKQNVGTGTSYTASDFTDLDTIECMLTSNAACAVKPQQESNSIIVRVNPVVNPAVTISMDQQVVCSGATTAFTASTKNIGVGVSYQWKINQQKVGNDTAVFITNQLKDADIVSCEIISAGTCAVTNTATSNPLAIKVMQNVTAAVAVTPNATSFCRGSNVQLTASVINSGISPVYVWQVNGNTVDSSGNSAFSSVGLNDKDIILCKLVSNAACVTNRFVVASPFIVSIVDPPTLVVYASDTVLCNGDELLLTSSTLNAGNNPTYEWRVNDLPVSSEKMFSGNRFKDGDKVLCFIQASTACNTRVMSNTINLKVNPLPFVQLDSVVAIMEGGSYTLNPVTSTDVSGYAWSPSSWLSNATAPKPVASPPATIVYTLTVSSDKGCEATDELKLVILKKLDVPNVFSPNGDGIHDEWQIPGLSSYPGCTVTVYDRDGQIIFRSVGYNDPWKGAYNGKPVPIGTYYYIIDAKNGFGQLSGSVTVIR